MLRTILCTFLFLQVTYGWNWFKPCRYMEHVNCDGYALADSYYYRDGNRDHHGHHDGDHDGDYHRHGHDNDNDNHRHSGWGHNHGDNDNNHRSGWGHNHGDNDNNHHSGWGHNHGDNDNHRHGGWGSNHGDNDNHRHGGWDHDYDDSKSDYHHHGGWGSGWHHDNWNGNKRICGSDGVTYKNRCSFVKAHCKHTNIELSHEGPCKAGETTSAPAKSTTAKPTVTDEFCKNLLQQPCHGVNPICATNGQSYDNECEFEKAKCFDASIHIKHLGTC